MVGVPFIGPTKGSSGTRGLVAGEETIDHYGF
jgi:hypothetical protein